MSAFGSLHSLNAASTRYEVEDAFEPLSGDHEVVKKDLARLQKAFFAREKLLKGPKRGEALDKLVTASKRGNMLLTPFIGEDESDLYLSFIYRHLSGDMDSAATMLNTMSVDYGIIHAAAALFYLVQPWGEDFRPPLLYRGLNLQKKLPKDTEYLPFSYRYTALSYSEDPVIAHSFAHAGSGYPYVVVCRPRPSRVLYHYSYIVKLEKAFTTRFAGASSMMPEAQSLSLVKGMKEADTYQLLAQQEVLLRSDKKFKQRIVPIKDIETGGMKYDPFADPDGVLKFYEKAQKKAQALPFRSPPLNEWNYETLDMKRRTALRKYEEQVEENRRRVQEAYASGNYWTD